MVHVRYPRTTVWAAAAVLALIPVAGCGDDNGSETPPTPTVTTPATPPESPPAASAPADPAAARAEIEKNWTAFFNPATSMEDRVKILENGDALRPLLSAFAGDENAARSSAKVTDVRFTSATEATVTYDLLVGGAPALPDSKGISVLQDDTWKVSLKTLCALVELGGNADVPGC
jgi:hypothetical protein